MKNLKDYINDSLENANKCVSKVIFISHASKDSGIVDEFIDSVLKLSCHFSPKEIAYTSREDTGVRPGDKIDEYIRDNIKCARIVLLMISDNYRQSEVCLNEMGAAWALNKEIIQVLLPGTSFKQLGWLMSLNKAIKIDVQESLDALFDRLCTCFEIDKNTVEWNRNKTKFLSFCKKEKSVHLVNNKLNNKACAAYKKQELKSKIKAFDVAFIVRGVEEGIYQFQLNIRLWAKQNVTIKAIMLCNDTPFTGSASKEENSLPMKYYIDYDDIDIERIKQDEYIKVVEEKYLSNRKKVMDLSIKENELKSLEFNGEIKTIRQMDGNDDLQRSGWFLRILFNVREAENFPLKLTIIDGTFNYYG